MQRSSYSRFNDYICPRCRLNSVSSQAKNQIRTLSDSRARRFHQFIRFTENRRHPQANKRSLSTSAGSNASAQVAVEFDQEDLIGKLPIRRTFNDGLERSINVSNSPTRNQLKAWSIQNAKEKAAKPMERVGIAPSLPNSVLTDEKPEEGEDEFLDEFNDYDEVLEGDHRVLLEPGDLVEHKSHLAKRQFAVFLGMSGVKHQFLLSDGRWTAEIVKISKSLTIPNFVSSEELQSILNCLPSMPEDIQTAESQNLKQLPSIGELPPFVSRPIMLRIATLTEDMLSFRRDNIELLDTLYESMAHDSEYRAIPLDELMSGHLETKFDLLSNGAKMAIYQAIDRDTIRTQPIKINSKTISVVITPKNLLRQFDKVIEWARQYQEAAVQASSGKDVTISLQQNPLNAFIEKARRLILLSRQSRSPTTIGILGPSVTQPNHHDNVQTKSTGETYSDNDKMILEFLWNTYLRQPLPRTRNRNHAIGSIILRAIGAYPSLRLENQTARLLLQELGSLAPWAERTDESIIFPLPGRRGAHLADRLFQESEKLCEELDFNPDTRKNPLPDTLAHLRKDLGDMQIFCIDKASTKVIDDGFSLEESTENPGSFWVHCHIAHPSAFITPDHIFSQRAQLFGASLYTSRQVYPMMPWDFVTTLGLASNSASLTISTLIGPEGDVKDFKLCPTIVRNVIKLERGAVDRLMGHESREKAYMIVGSDHCLTIGEEDEPSPEALASVKPYLPTLNKLNAVLNLRFKARQREAPDFINYEFSRQDHYARVSFLEPYDSSRILRSNHYDGDPTIKCVADRYEWIGRYGERPINDDVTSHVMILASESAGRWFKERRIPACFSGALTHPEFPLSKLNNLKENERFLSPVAKMSPTPAPHVMLNVSQYLRVTSPLRRYTDLLSHWQADAYFQGVASGLVTDGASLNEVHFPFTTEMVEEYIYNEAFAIREGDRLMKASTEHWTFQALFRAFHFHEASLPKLWDFKVENILPGEGNDAEDSRIRGRLLPFQLRATLLKSAERWEDEVKWQQYLPVKIELVDLEGPTVCVRAVGRPSAIRTLSGPIRIVPREQRNGTPASVAPSTQEPVEP